MIDFRDQNHVSIAHCPDAYYPEKEPFHPSSHFPEYPFSEISDEKNDAYILVRNVLITMEMDKEHFGSCEWNPLGDIIKSGQTILVKPNWVKDINPIEEHLDALITHSSIIRAILDYVVIALKGTGNIIVGDAPLQSCDFDQLLKKNKIESVLHFYRGKGIDVALCDFRLLIGHVINYGFLSKIIGVNIRQINREIQHHIIIDTGKESFLEPIVKDWRRFRVTGYDPRRLLNNHRPGVHKYLIDRHALNADVIINLPKMKTHIKAGITGALKNFIGINGHKDFLPHHRLGSAESGYDEYERKHFARSWSSRIYDMRFMTQNLLVRKALALPQKLLEYLGKVQTADYSQFGGLWKNDTISRTTLDINRIIYFADKQGVLRKTPQRTILSIIDGIVAGEGNGPLEPESKYCHLLLGGFNPVALDTVMARLMHFDYNSIPTLKLALDRCSEFVHFDREKIFEHHFPYHINSFYFKPPNHWKRHIELET